MWKGRRIKGSFSHPKKKSLSFLLDQMREGCKTFLESFSLRGRNDTHKRFLSFFFFFSLHPLRCRTQPPTAVCKIEAQSEYIHIAYTFFARLVPICMLSRCLLTKYLHRSSVGSLLRVRCWLGRRKIWKVHKKGAPLFTSTHKCSLFFCLLIFESLSLSLSPP